MAAGKTNRIKRSAVIRALSRFAERTAKRAENGLIARLLSGYFKLEKAQLSSFAAMLTGQKNAVTDAFSSLRDMICRAFTENPVKKAVTSYISGLLYMRTRDVGIYLFSSGLYAVIEYFIIKYAIISRDLPDNVLYGGIGVMILSLFFFSGKALCVTLAKNPILSFLTFDLIGADRDALKPAEPKKKNASAALLFGMLTGVLAFLIPPHRVVLLLFCLVIFCTVFFKPESGVVLTVAAVPFLQLRQLLILCAITTVSYLIKTLRRKRELRFRPIDISVMILAAFTLFGKLVTSGDGSGTDSLYLIGLAGYFICRNLLCKREWLSRALHAAALSSAAVSVFGLLFYFFGTPSQMLAAHTLFAGAGGEMSLFFGSSSALAAYLLLTAPLLLYFGFDGRNGRAAYFIAYAASFASLCLTGRLYAVISCVIVTVAVMTVYDRRFLVPVLVSVPVLLAGAAFVPGRAYSYLYSLLYSENALIGSVWAGTAKLISTSPVGGYGIGSFAGMYPLFALAGFGSQTGAKSVYLQICAEGGIVLAICFAVFLFILISFCVTCIYKCGHTENKRYIYGPLTAISALFMYGLVENVFDSPAVCMLAFAVAGIAAAASELCRREHDYAVSALEYGEV
ncbi:MAG: hypothetical protein J6330_00280 [Clostridia bacterium]|nr:hypothetical protein [Clostridia bacterium]